MTILKNLSLSLLCFVAFDLYSQNNMANKFKDVNLTIMIDDKVPFPGDLQVQIEFLKGDKRDTVRIDYLPGEISIDSLCFQEIQSEDVKEVNLLLKYTTLHKGDIKITEYKADFRKRWLINSFTLLRFYNLTNKKYRKIYFPLEGVNYTYEVDTPNGSEMRVRKWG